jgi:hypothetical protein
LFTIFWFSSIDSHWWPWLFFRFCSFNSWQLFSFPSHFSIDSHTSSLLFSTVNLQKHPHINAIYFTFTGWRLFLCAFNWWQNIVFENELSFRIVIQLKCFHCSPISSSLFFEPDWFSLHSESYVIIRSREIVKLCFIQFRGRAEFFSHWKTGADRVTPFTLSPEGCRASEWSVGYFKEGFQWWTLTESSAMAILRWVESHPIMVKRMSFSLEGINSGFHQLWNIWFSLLKGNVL